MEEQKLAIKLQVGEVLEDTKKATLVKHFKFNLNVAPKPETEEIIDLYAGLDHKKDGFGVPMKLSKNVE
ncbi:hypothetical protein H5410_002127 [Solanum commersonii]|uniref:Uncharacterized protein n=1 Tax=Solanum commersonii TaxID=4109 RepID=A0A9J6B1G1_SOLCO|nr:hypothetical protein H5410_002127 [Solanum commersonii]